MKLIVGLGNFGKEYEKTRHNAGFMSVDYFANVLNIEFKKEKFNGIFAETNINNEKIILLKPLSYMNNSGIVIKKFIDFYDINLDDLLIIYDDLDLDIGTYKLKSSGGTAGHNGLKSIELNLKTNNYKRLKIGISKNIYDKSNYVLGKFTSEEQEKLKIILSECSQILRDFIKLDFIQLMNKYN